MPQRDAAPMSSILRRAHVVAPSALRGAAGEDVFACEYEYDAAWQVGCGKQLAGGSCRLACR